MVFCVVTGKPQAYIKGPDLRSLRNEVWRSDRHLHWRFKSTIDLRVCKMKVSVPLTLVALAASTTAQQAQPWGQCGGNFWAGPTQCVAGWTCVAQNGKFRPVWDLQSFY